MKTQHFGLGLGGSLNVFLVCFIHAPNKLVSKLDPQSSKNPRNNKSSRVESTGKLLTAPQSQKSHPQIQQGGIGKLRTGTWAIGSRGSFSSLRPARGAHGHLAWRDGQIQNPRGPGLLHRTARRESLAAWGGRVKTIGVLML